MSRLHLPERATANPSTDRGLVMDMAGLALLLSAIAWTVATAAISGGSAVPAVSLMAGSAAAYSGARAISARIRWLVPLAVAVSVSVFALMFIADVATARPLSGPLGYRNASAAFYLQGAIGAAMVWASWRRPGGRTVGALLAVGLGLATVLTNSTAATVLMVLPIAALTVPARAARALVTVFVGLFLIALVSTLVLGATYQRGETGTLDRIVDAALSERRPALWHDALVLMARYPLTGVGPDRFSVESPIARSDEDARWAHNGFLQQGAETGVVGLILLIGIFLWGFGTLSIGPTDRTAALGAAALAALGLHATVDYVLHFPALPLMTAALVGTAVSPGLRNETRKA